MHTTTSPGPADRGPAEKDTEIFLVPLRLLSVAYRMLGTGPKPRTSFRKRAAPALLLAAAYYQRWQHEHGNKQLTTYLLPRGPGRVLRSTSPDMVRQEIDGYLSTHYAISALICTAATKAGIDPDRVKFNRTVPIIRRRAADPAAFPPEHQQPVFATVAADITHKPNLNPRHQHRTYPHIVKHARHHSYRIKKPSDTGTRHHQPPTIILANLPGNGITA